MGLVDRPDGGGSVDWVLGARDGVCRFSVHKNDIIISPWLNSRGKVCNRLEAEYGYVGDIKMERSGKFRQGSNVMMGTFKMDYGEAVYGLAVFGVKTRVYAKLEMVSYMAEKTYRRLGALYTGNCRALSKEARTCYLAASEVGLKVDEAKVMVSPGAYERQKVSQDHHIHLRPEEIVCPEAKGKITKAVECVDKKQIAVIKMLEAVYDKSGSEPTEPEVATWLLYASVAPEWAIGYLVHCVNCAIYDGAECYSRLKEESEMAKQLQGTIGLQLNYIFEANVLKNRVDGTVDWHGERKKRETFKPEIKIGAEKVYSRARRIFEQGAAEGGVPRYVEWKQYWRTRWARMPVGSFISQYKEDIDVKNTFDDKRNANKTTVFSAMKNKEHFDFLQRRPCMYASTSTKYEWGKLRALYGCDVTSFLHSDFAFGDAEDSLPSYFPVGQRATEEAVTEKIKCMASGIPVCYDYDDFNAQHSVEHMQAVLRAWIDVHAPVMSKEQIASGAWVVQSLNDMMVRDNATKELYTATGTLFSGWRLTSFVNTVLNRVYLDACGLKETLQYSVHNGDDVFGVAVNFKDVVTLMCKGERLGLRAQHSKQNVGTIAEFLRMDLFAKEQGTKQYLTRACATMTHGRIETEAVTSMEADIDSLNTRVEAIVSRGGRQKEIARLKTRVIHNMSDRYQNFEIAAAYYELLHPIQGGCNKNANVGTKRLARVSQFSNVSDTVLVYPGVQDYIEEVVKLLDIDARDIKKKYIKQEAKTMFKTTKYTLRVEDDKRRDLIRYKMSYRAHRESRAVAHISKLRIMGTDITQTIGRMTDGLAWLLTTYDNPMEAINMLT